MMYLKGLPLEHVSVCLAGTSNISSVKGEDVRPVYGSFFFSGFRIPIRSGVTNSQHSSLMLGKPNIKQHQISPLNLTVAISCINNSYLNTVLCANLALSLGRL